MSKTSHYLFISSQRFQTEVGALKEKLRRQKSSTDAVAAEQASNLEDELRRESQERTDRLLAAAQEKHRRELIEEREETQQLRDKLATMEQKVTGHRAMLADIVTKYVHSILCFGRPVSYILL